MADARCWNCGTSIDDVPRPISRQATCSKCFHELHCCRMCRHHDESASAGRCREERADPPPEKDVANFCDWFQPGKNAFQEGRTTAGENARSRLDALFGDSQGPAEEPDEAPPKPEDGPRSAEEKARAELDRLFSRDAD